jgi:hypothetical protein
MSYSPCWGPCGRTLWKDHSPHTHRQGAAPRCPLYTRPPWPVFYPSRPEPAETGSGPDGRVLSPLLSVDLMSGHGVLRLGMHVLFGVWKDQLIRFSQVLDVTEGG